MASELAALRARVAALEAVCGAAYQLAGTIGAPLRFLDALAAASGSRPIPDVDLLPVSELDCHEVRRREDVIVRARKLLGASAAAELGRAGGSKSSQAKRRAARLNGRKGGRPRKVA